MKRVELERQAIVKALDEAPNITDAAERLGASRRTLQARMRDYAMPPGQAGRPRQLLPKARETLHTGLLGSADAIVDIAVVGLALGAGWWFMRRGKEQVAGGGKPDCLRGLDVVLAR